MTRIIKTEFSESDINAFEPTEKVALIATKNEQCEPHLSLLTTLQAYGPNRMIMGEFFAGLSKRYMQERPETAFLIMTLDRSLWRGLARWTRLATEGPEYEMYNTKPMFRYNAYFGVNTVHYFHLVETGERESLPLGKIITSALLTKAAKGGARSAGGEVVLTPFADALFSRLDSLKFLSYIADDGFPRIIPLLQCQSVNRRSLVFNPGAYGDELALIPARSRVAVFGLTLQMEDVLVRGVFNGYSRKRGVRLGMIDVDWVYNSLPPASGQVYPRPALAPVRHF